ncbi:hypothetical protein [Heliophilum fasciatum]|uniref:Uncharacterized protein n=1 Tax=Heliophilum fasciatum TaxID=35700 RepID=A0A4R2RV15_9FIRM|nr:hypothetical protein [Heliophilum fasciatum]MCW2278356.1 TRAP-type mannitol/chloroaromatic compound transport system permease small subunit [Heliophilum fasciatum]TCP63771.1 hypothetical protein EDD73_11517 [Heliophilum fasciatum]
MIIFLAAVIALIVYYTLDYARYAWKQKNRSATAGAILLAILTAGIPILGIWAIK